MDACKIGPPFMNSGVCLWMPGILPQFVFRRWQLFVFQFEAHPHCFGPLRLAWFGRLSAEVGFRFARAVVWESTDEVRMYCTGRPLTGMRTIAPYCSWRRFLLGMRLLSSLLTMWSPGSWQVRAMWTHFGWGPSAVGSVGCARVGCYFQSAMRDVKSTLPKCTPAVVGAEAAVGALRIAFRKKLNKFAPDACSCVSCQCHFFFFFLKACYTVWLWCRPWFVGQLSRSRSCLHVWWPRCRESRPQQDQNFKTRSCGQGQLEAEGHGSDTGLSGVSAKHNGMRKKSGGWREKMGHNHKV